MSTTIEHDGFTIESNTETAEAMHAALGAETTEAPPDDTPATDATDVPPVSDDARVAQEPDRTGADATGRKAKPKENVQARINQALEKQRKAEERAAQLETELQQARARVPTPAEPQRPVPVSAPVGERFPSFDTWSAANEGKDYEDYIDARADHVYQARRQSERAQEAKESEQKAYKTLADAHSARIQALFEREPSMRQAAPALYQRIAPFMSDALDLAILRSDSSDAVIQWLATHPEDACQLAQEVKDLPASAAQLVKRLLEARLDAGVRPGSVPTAELSKAKPPVRPVGVSSVTVPEEPGEDEPFEAYFKRQNLSDRKRGRL